MLRPKNTRKTLTRASLKASRHHRLRILRQRAMSNPRIRFPDAGSTDSRLFRDALLARTVSE